MPRRTDRPGTGPPDPPAEGRPGSGSRDELRRRLENLPAGHPSSPWYSGARDRPGQDRAAGHHREPGADKSTDPGTVREGSRSPEGSEGSAGRGRRSRWSPQRDDGGGYGRGDLAEEAGQVPGAAGRALRGKGGNESSQDRSQVNEKLWARAAAQHAAAKARKDARRTAAPQIAPGRKDPFRPWFTGPSGGEPWLSSDGTGEPWFTRDD